MNPPAPRRFCRLLVAGFAALYGLALLVLAIGTFGLLGAEIDPLSGVYLIPLGLPWNLAASAAPDAIRPWLAMAAPALNLLLLLAVCARRRPGSSPTERQKP